MQSEMQYKKSVTSPCKTVYVYEFDHNKPHHPV